MDSELFDKILPVLSVLIGAIIGFFGNYIVGKSLFKKEVTQKKEDHLRELYHNYSEGLNSLFQLIDDALGMLKDLHNVRLTRKLEDEYEIIFRSKMTNIESKILNLDVIKTKYDFTTYLDLVDEMHVFRLRLKAFEEFLAYLENSKRRVPITDTEYKYIQDLEETVINIKEHTHSKMMSFYSTRFLPHK